MLRKPALRIAEPLAFIVKIQTDDRLTTEFLLHKDKKENEKSCTHSGTFVFARHTKSIASQSQKSLHFADTQTDR